MEIKQCDCGASYLDEAKPSAIPSAETGNVTLVDSKDGVNQ